MSAETLRALPPRQTDWFLLDAARVAAFADVTEDWQPIHLDGTAAQAAGFDAPVVHGFLTLSMLSAMSYQVVPELPGVRSSVNYGFDRIRFVSPVAVGTRVRGSFTVASVDEGEGHLTVHWDVAVTAEDMEKPALVAQWITRLVRED